MKICPKCKTAHSDRHDICNVCGSTLIDYETYKQQLHGVSSINTKQQYQPHCPICGSPDVEKISAGNKVGKAVLFGLFSAGSISKTYRCKNCGAKF